MRLFEAANSVDFVAYTTVFHNFEWKKQGGGQWTLCPFHSDGTPSFSFDRKRNKGKCFTCNTPLYSLVDFMAAYLRIEPSTAAKLICEDMGIEYDENPNQGRIS